MDNEWIEAALRRKQREDEVFKVLSFETDESSFPKGGNYMSVVKRCKLELMLNSGRRTKKTFVVKVKLEGKKAEGFKDMDLFKVESYIYDNVLKQMESLMDVFEDNREKMWCQMYGYKPYSEILLEDLKKISPGPESCQIIFKIHRTFSCNVQNFDRTCRILIERGLLSATDIMPFYVAKMTEPIKHDFEGTSRHVSKIIRNKWPAEWKDFGVRIGKLSLDIVKRLQELTIEERNRESAFLVLNHGDSWTTNMMFKYSDGIPTSIKLIDFQVSHVSSYIWDILYFLYASVQPHVRRSNIKDLLRIYWESLDTNLRRFGYDKYIPSLNDVMKRKDLYSLAMLCYFYPVQTADLEDAFDPEKLADGADDMISEEAFLAPNVLRDCADDYKYFMNKGVL